MVTVSDGKCRPQTTRLKLSTDSLVLQREEFIFPDDDDGYPVDNKVNLFLNPFFTEFFSYKNCYYDDTLQFLIEMKYKFNVHALIFTYMIVQQH